MIKLDFYTANNEIGNLLDKNEPASILRIDNTMGYVLNSYSQNIEPSEQWFNDGTFVEGGVYPIDKKWYQKNIIPIIEESMRSSDILGFVDISGDILNGNYLSKYEEYQMKKVFNSYLVMDPGALLGYSYEYDKVEIPWTSKLKNKKVLVISTHKESILSQWKNIDKIWGDNKEVIAPFDLVDVIRSPYHPFIDERQPPNCENWLQSVEFIKDQIDNYEYDILLAGCTVSAPLYVNHAKQRGKIGIQTGGTIQLLFGVKGYRWTKEVKMYERWEEMYNDFWTFPLKEDEARKRKNLIHLEANFAYW